MIRTTGQSLLDADQHVVQKTLVLILDMATRDRPVLIDGRQMNSLFFTDTKAAMIIHELWGFPRSSEGITGLPGLSEAQRATEAGLTTVR